MFKPHHAALALFVMPALAAPVHAAAPATLPLKGSEAGTFQMTGPCGDGGSIVEVTGTGHSALLGAYSARYRECLDAATGAVTDGTFTLTAASGDEISGTFTGQARPTDSPNVVHFVDPGVITGGTGRFAGATGAVTQSGFANLATGEYESTVSGSVTRP